ncbi:ferrochelatase [Mobilicoccus massiliensis]|uniref:ferrochelatase n=1 Tax=Mobilicoccus massiliensis TaxID=1522310 RepID=UPI000B11F5B0|nr:ferrochelatase [Mobilicoccus massiliensis]
MSTLAPYDAVMVLSFGGPESPEDVMPFLRHVTGGRGIPDSRLAEVAHHYDMRGGVSPINDENRRLIAALKNELAARGESVPVLWGNRHAAPFTVDALREAGARRIVVVVTSAYPSYSGCRQYREDLAEAVGEIAAEADPQSGVGSGLRIDKVRPYSDHPGFVEAAADRTVATLRAFLAEHGPSRPHLAFVTHSIPVEMERTSGPHGGAYLHRHAEVVEQVMARVREIAPIEHSLVYCSRSGPPRQPWLEPDIGDHLRALSADGVDGVVVSPIGFVADHMEVVHDLDTEAAGIAAELGLAFTRVPTVQDDPRFVRGLVDLLEERAREARGEVVTPVSVSEEPLPSVCAPGCCPNLRGERPALCEESR